MNAELRDFFTRRSPGTGKAILGIWLACWLAPAYASGLPQGGTITHGQGSISKPSATQMQIDQFSQRMAADFYSFDIAKDHGVNISQPGMESLFVGRITGESATQIFGTLTADGQVMLLNPRGVVFGEGSRVDTASLMASTLNVDVDRVMEGMLELEFSADIAGKIINRGTLTAATGGSVTLLGDEVINEGLIVADMGRVNLASGSKAFVTFDAERLIGVQITEGALGGTGGDSAVANLGEIQAHGGQILLTAKAARDLFSMAVNNEGILRANHAQEVDGEIRLFASEGDTFTSGTIEATSESGRGGSIEVLGERVAVTGGRIDASGATGGGDIKIGGAFQGRGDTPTASHTYVGPDAQIAADATVAGDGGEVIVWADDTTRFHGEI
ncbi:MAG: filamentous hemagglutinin N-terminal domain-containing protein, partial [Gammaproteobacteria bacterium]|nr:filamentous hemagglutinin N-terminal domain-containing protein [Gammaproteobacteria bacterium]